MCIPIIFTVYIYIYSSSQDDLKEDMELNSRSRGVAAGIV